MNLTRRAFGAFLGASAAAFSLRLGQTPAFAREGAPRRGGTLTFGVETEPATLNGQINGQAKARVVLRNIFDSLLARSPSGETVPWLAEAYEIRDDGRTYVFTLREGIRFTDGLALDAEAVALNFRKIRDPAYGKGLATGPAARLVDAKPLDARRVSLTLSETYAPFLSFASGLEILSPAAFDSPELRSGGKSVAGTGPFVLKTYVKGQEVRLVRNPDYRWGPANAPQQGPAYLDEVVYRFLPESAVRTGALASGQVDVIEGISGNDAAIFRDDESYSYQRAHNTGTPYSLFLNVEHGATADVAVRRALIAAVDVDRVVASIYRGERERAFGIASPVEGDFYDPAAQASAAFDPSLANRLLDEAGWRTRDDDGFRTRNGERLRIEVVQSQATVRDQRDVLLQAVQAQAKQNAGIDVALTYVDAGTYADRQKTGNYGSIPNSRTPADDGVDIEYHYLPVAEGGSVNYSRTADPQIRDWLREAASTLDRRARADLYARVQARALEQALVLPLYVPEDQIAAGAHVRGLRFRPYAQQPESAYGVWLDV